MKKRLSILLLACAVPASAEVARVEILSVEPFAGGAAFGDAGAYEMIRGRLHYAIVPTRVENRRVADVALAPVGPAGEIAFAGDFALLKPARLERGNHRLLYDVNNRGSLTILSRLNRARWSNTPSTREHAGDGFLMRHGYTILWSAWNWDAVPGDDRLQIDLPIARLGGRPITGTVSCEMVTDEPAEVLPVAWGNSRGYPALAPEDPESATLTVRDHQRDPRVEVPRDTWRFEDPTHVRLDGGFEPGRIYEVVYEATDARVVGLGLAAIRDALSFFRFEREDRDGNPNPLLRPRADAAPAPDPELSLIFGISQSGRVIQHMLWQGFHVDEKGRMVFDAAMPHVSGAGKGSFNHRWAQTTRHPSPLEDHQYPADFFPFATTPQVDPVTGRRGDVLAVPRTLGAVPKIMYTGTATEYWTRAASPLHVDVTGHTDLPLDERVRLYVITGAQHQISTSVDSDYAYPRNVLDHAPPLRALLLALDRWASDGLEPPPSAYPRLDRAELVTAENHARLFPAIPGVRHPGGNLQPPRLELGPRFVTQGVVEEQPPPFGPAVVTVVPAPDEDGNDRGGIRLPGVAVPLGTYAGWNMRTEAMGNPGYPARWAGSFFAFAATRHEREASGDPRLSIGERYASQQEYAGRVAAVADELVAAGYLLREDRDAIVEEARSRAWPPRFE